MPPKEVKTATQLHIDNHANHVPFMVALMVYLGAVILLGFGHARDFVRNYIARRSRPRKGYAPILQDFEEFYTRRMYKRIQDCWSRPICSAPDSWFDVMERKMVWPKGSDTQVMEMVPGKTRRCLNLASYNYLGFAAQDDYCTPRVIEALKRFGVSNSGARMDAGTNPIHRELERTVAKFVGKEDAICFGMGFATNSTVLPALVSKGCLILSDALNHTSIVAGARLSGATIRPFRHNDLAHLERLLRYSIADGQPKTGRAWKKVLILIEGIYSMEGECCLLREIVELKNRYKAFLFLDEAHSIGAMGPSGRGLCDHAGVDPRDVDVLMGTFTKSFGSCGGYIAANREVVEYLRRSSPGSLYAASMAPAAAAQALYALKLVMGEDGTTRGQEKIRQLKMNSNYFRARLHEMGVETLGDWDSPVIPIMIYVPGKIAPFSRACFDRGIGLVVVGFPATPLLMARARVCISAQHTKEDLDWALKVLEDVTAKCLLQHRRNDPLPVPEWVREQLREYR